ncbi:MAG: hypothetical protein M3217_07840 [Actinomycetota bacterium]|nr:hypothetical protein [Actinomycetota bacterium]
MRKLSALAFALSAALPLALTPAAHASDQFVSAEACPDGYKGVIVGYNHPKFGSKEAFVCTNLV